jgi:NAD-dependent SIR2 family protein deacetylase
MTQGNVDMTDADDEAALHERIRTSKVFVLGAGFSAAAGIPLTNEL